MTKWVVRHLSWIISETKSLIDFKFYFMTKCGCKLSSILSGGYCKMVTNLTLFKVHRRIIFGRWGLSGVFLTLRTKIYY